MKCPICGAENFGELAQNNSLIFLEEAIIDLVFTCIDCGGSIEGSVEFDVDKLKIRKDVKL